MLLPALAMLTATPSTPPATDSFLQEFAETRRYLAGRPVGAKVTPDGSAVLFLRSQPKDARQMLFEFDVKRGQTKELLTPEALLQGAAETLTAAEKARLERMRVSARGFTSFQLSADGKRLLVALSGRLYVVERASGKVQQLKTGDGACLDPKFSPDGAWVAYVRNHDVMAVELAKNVEHAVTTGGTEERPHGLAEFVAQEEMSRFQGFWFSPDGAQVAFQETDHAGLERFGIADPLHPEAEVERFFYPRPGKKNAAVRLGVVPLKGGKPVWLSWDAERFPYLATVKWPAKGPLTLVVQNRAQTQEQVLAAEPKTGATRVLLTEEDAAWLNLAQEFPLWLPDGSGFLWMSEKSGTPDLELRKPDGALDQVWVKDVHGYDGHTKYVVGYSEKDGQLYVFSGPNPTEAYVARVAKGGVPERVTGKLPAPALETAAALSGELLVVTTTSATAMAKTFVLKKDGAVLGELPSVALEPKLQPKLTLLQLKSGQRSWAAVLKPQGFAPGKKYPVVLNVYAGPGHLEVTQTLRENLVLQWLADQGFIVVKLDGRGTPRRGRDFERAIKGDFATVTAADQLDGLKALAAEVPELDLTRVGVYGWSFGGYMAALLGLAHGDQVKAAVAGAPVVDWLDYDTHYTERYLGVPPDAAKAYDGSSLLAYVDRAKRPLLLIHGTADDNVYFLHTLKLSDALFKAGKPHAVLPLANFTHMVPDPIVTQRLWQRIAGFFKETL